MRTAAAIFVSYLVMIVTGLVLAVVIGLALR